MKKVLLSALLIIALYATTNAQQTFLSEEFNYSAGAALLSSGWTISGTSTINPFTVTSPGLTYTGVQSIGNSLTFADNGQDAYKAFTGQNSGSLYLTFLLKVMTTGTGDYFIAMSPASSQTNYYARFHVKTNGAGYSLGISKSNEVSGGASYGTTVLTFNTTYLVVVKYTFNAGTTDDDVISVYVFSGAVPTTEPGTAEIQNYANATKTDATDLASVTLRQGTAGAAPTLVIDAIRVTNSWSRLTVGVEKEANIIPNTYSLDQNYPNPFNPTTKISFSVPEAGYYNLKVYDVLGKEVAELVSEELSAGKYNVNFNASNLASGTYIYTLRGNNVNLSHKMLLVK